MHRSKVGRVDIGRNIDAQRWINVDSTLMCLLGSDSMLFNTCDEEIRTLLSQLPINKIASLYNVTYEHLKHGGSMLNKVITDLFNAILNSETIPTRFKKRWHYTKVTVNRIATHRATETYHPFLLSRNCLRSSFWTALTKVILRQCEWSSPRISEKYELQNGLAFVLATFASVPRLRPMI